MTMPGVQNPHWDPPVTDERSRVRVAYVGRQAFDRRHNAPGDTRHRRDARDTRFAVHEHGATAALSLGRAPILRRRDPEPFPQHVEQRLAGRGVDRDRGAVAGELDSIGHRTRNAMIFAGLL